MLSKEHRGSLYAISSGFLYGFVGYFGVTVVRESLSVTNMLFWRFFISSSFMVIVLLLRAKAVKDSPKEMFIAFLNGAAFYSVSTMLYFFAVPYIGSGLSMVIFFAYPAIVMLLNGVLFRQKIPPLYYCAILIILVGMTLFVDKNEMQFDLFGIALAVVSALFYAGYMISSKKRTISSDVSTLMVSLGCMVSFLLISLANQTIAIPHTMLAWRNLFGIGILSTAVPILLLLRSLNSISSEKASILSVLEPVFVVIFGVALLGEPMKLRYVLGIVIVLSGALLTLTQAKEVKVGR